jgi:hypothetical protein
MFLCVFKMFWDKRSTKQAETTDRWSTRSKSHPEGSGINTPQYPTLFLRVQVFLLSLYSENVFKKYWFFQNLYFIWFDMILYK